MQIPSAIVIDYETKAIQDRPYYPPEPVGVSIKWPSDRKSRYYAWGHPTGNNCDKAAGKRRLMEAYTSGLPLLFYNAKFDVDVGEVHMGLPTLPWEMYHDAMFVLFLVDPHARDMRLKPMAKKYLGMEPEEQDAVREWLKANKVCKNQNWGAFISEAPGDVVGTYANGDIIRTERLFRKFYAEIVKRGMLKAYDRERQLMPILLKNEREGVRVDMTALRADIPRYQNEFARADAWLRKALKAPDLNLDADLDVAEALAKSGVVTEWQYTPTGQRSVAKGALPLTNFHDKRVGMVYGYRNRLATCLRMFMEPWLAKAEASGGLIHMTWNQVRQPKGGKDTNGTRTGRPSVSNPNLLNLSKDWYDKGDGYTHPKFLHLEELPFVRRYIVPDKGGVFCHRDYNQQELRILGHFEDGGLLSAYRLDPFMDVHDWAKDLIARITGLRFERRAVKITNFGKIYGRGIGSTAEALGISTDEARKLMRAHEQALPGIPELYKAIRERVGKGEPITTWGGREYYCEEPIVLKDQNNKVITFEYKLVNYLVQGSAADITKEAIIRYDSARKEGRFLTSVYDEINISAPRRAVKAEMAILRECMEGLPLDVPLLSDGDIGPNWHELTKFTEPTFDYEKWKEAA